MWKKWLWISVVVLVGLFLVPYSLPLIFAFITAVMLEGLVQWLMIKLRFNRLQAVIIVFTGYVLLMTVIGYNLISIIAEQTVALSGKTPNFMKNLYISVILPLIRKWEFYSKNLPKDVIVSIEKTLENSINSLDSFLQGVIQNTVNLLTAIPGFLIEFLIYLIALFLISLELPRLKAKMEMHLKEQTKRRVYLVANQLNKAGIGFIKAQIILSLLTFIMAFIGLSILKVPYTGLLSLLIVIVDILPILGTGSVLVPWAVIAILQDNHFLGIGLIVLFLIITVVRRIIEPKVYSTSLGISPLAALISLYIGFKLLGVVGVILGPALVIVFDTLKRANIIKMKFKI
ncbi:sporulation integral membrane protein YtvI [Bacillus methanolicus]|uniref:sporulation integral membrane protein YtvI n=1 Tax=Bacillus methanolicus TaxID=1471 RepID=UPI0023801E6D|nr:sporulation integral membrane protein YtvI [Bacillus methanolicus]MDE3838061.1 sporulation integral membrane protein YtvI [Bacillus methanolicus]